MVELTANSPFSDLLPVTVGDTVLAQTNWAPLSSVAPFNGQHMAAAKSLARAHGLAYPGPGQATCTGDARLIWFGHDSVMLSGVAAQDGLQALAAVTDQSDAWAAIQISGPQIADVLARLVPIDLRWAQFGDGATARTSFGHMNVSITRVAPDALVILVFRSMVQTLISEVKEAMEAVAARG